MTTNDKDLLLLEVTRAWTDTIAIVWEEVRNQQTKMRIIERLENAKAAYLQNLQDTVLVE